MAGSMNVKHIKSSLVPSLAYVVYLWADKINAYLFPGVGGSNFRRDMFVSQLVFLAPLASVKSLYVLRNMQSHIFLIHDNCYIWYH